MYLVRTHSFKVLKLYTIKLTACTFLTIMMLQSMVSVWHTIGHIHVGQGVLTYFYYLFFLSFTVLLSAGDWYLRRI